MGQFMSDDQLQLLILPLIHGERKNHFGVYHTDQHRTGDSLACENREYSANQLPLQCSDPSPCYLSGNCLQMSPAVQEEAAPANHMIESGCTQTDQPEGSKQHRNSAPLLGLFLCFYVDGLRLPCIRVPRNILQNLPPGCRYIDRITHCRGSIFPVIRSHRRLWIRSNSLRIRSLMKQPIALFVNPELSRPILILFLCKVGGIKQTKLRIGQGEVVRNQQSDRQEHPQPFHTPCAIALSEFPGEYSQNKDDNRDPQIQFQDIKKDSSHPSAPCACC